MPLILEHYVDHKLSQEHFQPQSLCCILLKITSLSYVYLTMHGKGLQCWRWNDCMEPNYCLALDVDDGPAMLEE